MSVVVHQGRGIDTGHYTALVNESHASGSALSSEEEEVQGCSQRTASRDPSRDTWMLIDDHRVSVLPSLSELRKAQAYLLVYERVEVEGHGPPSAR